mmetsp:Transcript_7602/g.17022  ORF Transcript_7602/g.17022 Transcript_7602/m.17022 type:complete len:214 (-) Transcript_7602:643-1284(-)
MLNRKKELHLLSPQLQNSPSPSRPPKSRCWCCSRSSPQLQRTQRRRLSTQASVALEPSECIEAGKAPPLECFSEDPTRRLEEDWHLQANQPLSLPISKRFSRPPRCRGIRLALRRSVEPPPLGAGPKTPTGPVLANHPEPAVSALDHRVRLGGAPSLRTANMSPRPCSPLQDPRHLPKIWVGGPRPLRSTGRMQILLSRPAWYSWSTCTSYLH